ncbi:DUF4270 family protein [Chitinophaga niabensis]|uniref:DUF4270 domain-containing protein n=1 Tax=Chitinophaga niabensis TaxID=536979 RepID=A0A1N6EFR1_9BACT|nr:DUF4270 family protein [Chitinophaga niabensis]SIN81844.1 protein of unknown function [Chitinophaga niabensis]
MKINFRNLGYSAAFLTALYAFTGCNESTILGKDLIPGSDKVTVKDTTINNLITLNVQEADSSIRTGQANYGAALGSITDDPIFGKSSGFLYTGVGLPKLEFSFAGTGQTLDSVVLYIGCDTLWYGENQGMNLRVYRMNEPDFKADSNYSYTRPLSYDQGELLANVTAFPVYPKDSLSIYGVKQAPALRIPLSAAFGNLLLQQRADGAFKDDTTFKAFLKGLAIVPDTNVSKTMLFVNLNKGDTRISVYYKNSTEDSLIANFPFQQYYSPHANYFTRNYTNAQVAPYLNTNKPTGDTAIYLQEAPGIYTKFQIPGIENFPKAIINKAELVFTKINSNLAGKEKIFTDPDRLFLWRYITHDSLGYIVDYGNPSNPDLAYFGGNRTVISNIGGIEVVQYKFNIARHLQFMLDKKLDNSVFKLEAVSNRHQIDMRSVKVGGGTGTPPINAKLRIIYTQL